MLQHRKKVYYFASGVDAFIGKMGYNLTENICVQSRLKGKVDLI